MSTMVGQAGEVAALVGVGGCGVGVWVRVGVGVGPVLVGVAVGGLATLAAEEGWLDRAANTNAAASKTRMENLNGRDNWTCFNMVKLLS